MAQTILETDLHYYTHTHTHTHTHTATMTGTGVLTLYPHAVWISC